MYLLDLVNRVAGVLQPSHGGTGSTHGEQRTVQKCLNSTGASIALYAVVEYTFATNAKKVRKVTALDAPNVLGVCVGYYDGTGLVEAACPDGREMAVLTAGTTPILIESAVTRGEYAFAAATDGTIYSGATAATGALGYIVTSANTSTGATTAVVTLPATAALGGGGATFGTPSLTLSTSNSAGAASTTIRTDATIAAFDATVPVTQAFGDSAATGSAGKAARRDHKHGMPASPGVTGAFILRTTAPATGVIYYIELPYGTTWSGWTVLNDTSGSIQYDVWQDTYANYPPAVGDTITASDKPKTTSATTAQGSCTGWTSGVSARFLAVNIDSVSGLTWSELVLKYTKV